MRLNLGCGKNAKGGWTNVDLERPGKGIEKIDLTFRWPWPNGSCDYVYAEHLLEHLQRHTTKDDAKFFMEEA